MKKQINDRLIASLKPANAGSRYDVMDSLAPGFGVRVTDTGHKSYFLYTRPPGSKSPVRRIIGQVGSMKVAAARDIALAWKRDMVSGVDPKIEKATKAAAITKAKGNTFSAALESYIVAKLGDQKKKDEISRLLRRDFAPLNARPLDAVKRVEIADIVTKITQGRIALHYVKRFFNWAADMGKIDYSPIATVNPSTLFGKLVARNRVLTDDELKRVWHAAVKLGYPFGPIYQMLILTGLRLNEVADAVWSEVDMRAKTWTIPAERMKGKVAHVVPLCPQMIAIFKKLPRWNMGDFMYSRDGTKPLTVSNHVKGQMDIAAKVYGWVNHDLRRTMRSHLSKLPIEEHVRELMIAHKRKGIAGVYDQADYLDEKRAGFELWCARLATVVSKERMAA